MSLKWPVKDPDEVLDYELDWTARLAGDTILSSVWTASEPTITMDTDSFDDSSTFLWLSDGDAGVTYRMLNHITTLGARTMEQTVRIRIREK